MAKASIERSRVALSAEVSRCRFDFERLLSLREVMGDWDDSVWVFKGRKYFLTSLEKKFSGGSRKAYSKTSIPISGDVGEILRCYVASIIKNGASAELLFGRLHVAKILILVIGNDLERWISLSRSDMDRCMKEIHASYEIDSTRYHRCNDLKAFHKYLLMVRAESRGKFQYFLEHRIPWVHGMQNPIREIELKKLDNINSRGDKYPEGLVDAVGRLRKKVIDDPSIESKPGYDQIRLNILAFGFALGLRLGEITRLPIDAHGYDSRAGITFVRCWTEKGAVPIARPVPPVWSKAVQDAYEYLKDACSGARDRAEEIEKNGFNFVTSVIDKDGKLDEAMANEFTTIGIDAGDLCPLKTILENFDISPKSFNSSGKYASHVVAKPSLMAVRLIVMLNDFKCALQKNTPSVVIFSDLIAKDGRIPMERLGLKAGICRGNIKNVGWIKSLIRSLSELLSALVAAELVEGEGSHAIRSDLISFIDSEISILKDKKCYNRGLLVNYKTWVMQLANDYAISLRQHYKENCDAEAIVEGSFSYQIGSSSFEETLPLSRHLAVAWEGQFDASSKYNGILPAPVLRSDIYNYLSSGGSKKTVFEVYGIKDRRGKIYSFTPHQIRHWVTTALLRSGPNEMMVDLWMGRSKGQLRHYDHRTPKERAEYIRDKGVYSSITPPADWLGRKINSLRESKFSQQEIDEFIDEKLSLLHFTPWGYCSRELTVMPCSKGLMCLKGFGDGAACSNFHIDPTDKVARKNISDLLDSNRKMIKALEPRYEELRDRFVAELDSSQRLDQHLTHLLRVISGCEAALAAYAQAEARESVAPVSLREMEVGNEQNTFS